MNIVFTTLTLDSPEVKAQLVSMIEHDCAPTHIVLLASHKKIESSAGKIKKKFKFYSHKIQNKVCALLSGPLSYPNYKSPHNYNTKVLGGQGINEKQQQLLNDFFKKNKAVFMNGHINSDVYLNFINKAKPDMIVSTMCGIVGKRLIDTGIPVMNVHASKLPAYRGMNCVEWALWNNDQVYCSYHRMATGIDEGDILFQLCLDENERLTKGVSINELRRIYFHKAFINFGSTVKKYYVGELKFVVQQKEHLVKYPQAYSFHKILRDKLHEKLVKIQNG